MIKKIYNLLRRMKHGLNRPDHKRIFAEIYKNKTWGTDHQNEFYSGTGSDAEYAGQYADVISRFIKDHNIKAVVDLGCGDFRIGRRITESTGVQYTGVDVVEELITYNNQNYRSDTVRFVQKNIVRDDLPDGELCLIRQVLQHLSNSDIKKILRKCSRYKYLIVTEHLPLQLSAAPNIDKQPGASIRYFSGSGVYLDKPPYNKELIELLAVFPEDHPGSKIITCQIVSS